MIASDFTRDDCQLGQRRISYAKLQREYRCNACGGRLTVQWTERCASYPQSWHIECGACGGHDFIHEYELQHQKGEAVEVLDGLPSDLLALMGLKQERHEPQLVKLGQKPTDL